MHVDFLIIGQGICGTFLHWYLSKQGYNCAVIDDNKNNSASRIAAGIINPVTGRRIVKTWMIDELMPFAIHAYHKMGEELELIAIEYREIIDFFSTPQNRQSFYQRLEESQEFLKIEKNEDILNSFFTNDLGFGKITPAYLVQIGRIITAYRKKLLSADLIYDQSFDIALLNKNGDHWKYKDIRAGSVIFCDGIQSVRNPYFNLLPFALNKGEVLYLEIKKLPTNYIYKKGINLVNVGGDTYWAGSSYEWDFHDDQPSIHFLDKTTSWVKQWLKIPFQVIDHRASIRPATLERRPFVGFHPVHQNIGILNGMGTKGCTLAPWFANELTNHIRFNTALNPEADIRRFNNLLRRDRV